MLKRWMQGCVVMVCLLVVSAMSFAAIPSPTGKSVNDFAGVIKPEHVAGIEHVIAEFESKNVPVKGSIVIVTSLDGSNPEQYAREVLAKWGGPRVLLLIATKENVARLVASDQISGALNRGIADKIVSSSESIRGVSKRCEYIFGEASKILIDSRVPAKRTVTPPVAKAVTPKAPSKPLGAIWYVLLAFIILVVIMVPVWSTNSKRRKVCAQKYQRCLDAFEKLKAIYVTAIESYTILLEKYPKNVDASYSTLIDESLDNYEVQIGAAYRKCTAFFVSSDLAAMLDSIYEKVNDLKNKCTALVSLEGQIDDAKENVLNLFTNVIPLSIEGIQAELEKGAAYETVRTDFLSIVAEFQSLQLDPDSADTDWIRMNRRLSDISRSLDTTKRRFETKKQEVHEAQERATTLLNDMPARLAEAEAKATTAEARRQVAEARVEYERARQMQQSSGPDIVDWLILDSMLNHSRHTVQTVYVEPAHNHYHREEVSYGRAEESRGRGWSNDEEERPAPSYTPRYSEPVKPQGNWGSDDDEPEVTKASRSSWSDDDDTPAPSPVSSWEDDSSSPSSDSGSWSDDD